MIRIRWTLTIPPIYDQGLHIPWFFLPEDLFFWLVPVGPSAPDF